MAGLNPHQHAAVRHVDTPLLVLAGAGSGKTRVITTKIAHLVQDHGLAARNIVAVTFTNKAAREMRERASGLLKKGEGKGLTVSTFHNLGLNILRREHRHVGLKPGFTIFDSADSHNLIREILRKGLNLDPDVTRAQISTWKNDLILPDQAFNRAENDVQIAISRVYEEYQRGLKAYNGVDFDDLILHPVVLFQSSDEVRSHWQDRIRHLLVDEYQDTNGAQYELVRALVGKVGVFTAVGDDDQSIYTWRGARPENLQRLQEDFPRLKVVKLEQNYRSSGRILKAANQLIDHNVHVFKKRLWSELGYGDPLRVLACKDAEHEAERVVSELVHHQFQSRARHGDYAILYRGNFQSRPFEKVLREHRIPYHLSGGTSFFEYTEVKDFVAYLRLLANEDDDRAFLRVVNTPRRELGASTLEKLGQYAGERGISLIGACYELGLEQVLPERAVTRLRRFAEWVMELNDAGKGGDPMSVVHRVLAETQYEDWLRDTAKEPKDAERRLQNLDDLLSWLKRMVEQLDDNASLVDLVNRVSLMDLLDRDKEEGGGDCVHLMTLHAAKGLEFPHVFLVGVEEEILPHRTSIAEDNLEEERRLAYVGITRAQKTLTFSFARRRKRAGEWMSCEPSRFLEELPADDLEWEGNHENVDPEKRQERGRAHLANLRGLLG